MELDSVTKVQVGLQAGFEAYVTPTGKQAPVSPRGTITLPEGTKLSAVELESHVGLKVFGRMVERRTIIPLSVAQNFAGLVERPRSRMAVIDAEPMAESTGAPITVNRSTSADRKAAETKKIEAAKSKPAAEAKPKRRSGKGGES